MRFNFFKNLFNKKHRDDKKNDQNVKVSKDIGADINVENNDGLIKIEIEKDCTLQEYSEKIDSLLQSDSENIDKTLSDMIDKLPMRMLISNGIKTINRQTIYLISNNNFKYIISANSDNIYLSESKIENKNINENTIKICLANEEYQISKYVHDINKSTKSVKFYNPTNNGNEFFYMDIEEATAVVESMIEHLDKIEVIKNILNFDNIHSYLKLTELRESSRTEENINIDYEK